MCVCVYTVLQEKVSSLEASLVSVVREFDKERETHTQQAQRILQEARYMSSTFTHTSLTCSVSQFFMHVTLPMQ